MATDADARDGQHEDADTDITTAPPAPRRGAVRRDGNANHNANHNADSPNDSSSSSDSQPSPQELRDELERTRQALSRANKSDKERRLRLEELERAEQERKDANLGEAEKINRARAEAERRAQEAEKRAEARDREIRDLRLERLIEADARSKNFEHPELAFKLVDRTLIEHDPDLDRWEGIGKAVELLAKAYPDLIRQKRPGPGSPPRDEHPGNPSRRGRPSGRQDDEDPFVTYASERINYERM